MSNFRCQSIDQLFQAILNLESVEDCYRFFEDVCTIKEVQDMAQRFDVALLLDDGVNYQTISQKVSVSTATISRVSKCFNYGSGGYRLAIKKLKESEGNK